MMDMPDALLTVLLQNMCREERAPLVHIDAVRMPHLGRHASVCCSYRAEAMFGCLCRAALQCVNRRLRRLCGAVGEFKLLQAFGDDMFVWLQRHATGGTMIDGLKIQGDATGVL